MSLEWINKAMRQIRCAREESDNQELRYHLSTLESEIAVVITDIEEGNYK